jgi:hypothetical protein
MQYTSTYLMLTVAFPPPCLPPSLQELTLEEARARRDRLAKMRSLLFYHELKAKRLKAIKSKEFHRKQAKVRAGMGCCPGGPTGGQAWPSGVLR